MGVSAWLGGCGARSLGPLHAEVEGLGPMHAEVEGLGPMHAEVGSPEAKGAAVGSQAPTFDLPVQGAEGRVRVPGTPGVVSLVDFWATWCEACERSMPHYQALAERYGDRLRVAALCEDDDPSAIASFARRTGARFALAWDAEHAVATAYRPGGMPAAFVVDAAGVIRHVQVGFEPGDEREIDRAIAALLAPR